MLMASIHFLDFFTGSDSIQGTWCKDILQTIMSFTPHNWASHTLSCFPAPLQVMVSNDFISGNTYSLCHLLVGEILLLSICSSSQVTEKTA